MDIYQIEFFRKWIIQTFHFLPFYFSVIKTEQRATFLCQRSQASGVLLLYLLLPTENSSPTALKAGSLLRERKVEYMSYLLYLPTYLQDFYRAGERLHFHINHVNQ